MSNRFGLSAADKITQAEKALDAVVKSFAEGYAWVRDTYGGLNLESPEVIKKVLENLRAQLLPEEK
jgi:hypothetical protein